MGSMYWSNFFGSALAHADAAMLNPAEFAPCPRTLPLFGTSSTPGSALLPGQFMELIFFEERFVAMVRGMLQRGAIDPAARRFGYVAGAADVAAANEAVALVGALGVVAEVVDGRTIERGGQQMIALLVIGRQRFRVRGVRATEAGFFEADVDAVVDGTADEDDGEDADGYDEEAIEAARKAIGEFLSTKPDRHSSLWTSHLRRSRVAEPLSAALSAASASAEAARLAWWMAVLLPPVAHATEPALCAELLASTSAFGRLRRVTPLFVAHPPVGETAGRPGGALRSASNASAGGSKADISLVAQCVGAVAEHVEWLCTEQPEMLVRT